MKDEIEKIIAKHKSQMNFDKPNHEFVWNSINKKLESKNRVIKLSVIWKSVAALIVIGILSYSLFTSIKNEQRIEEFDQYSLKHISKEAYQREQMLLKQIDKLTIQLNKKSTSNPEQYKTYYNEINVINELTQEYKKNIPIHGSNKRLIEALIKCYENQYTILENLLTQIEQTEKYNTKKL